jgi:hypothetical protein
VAYSYNTSTKKVTVTATSTAKALHDDIQTTFAGSTYMQYLIPDSGSILNALYIFQNSWDFYDSTSIGYMTTGGWQDAAGDNKWTNVKCISGDTFTGIQLYYDQEGTPTNFGATGLVNCLLKVRDGGSDINSQAYTVYQRTFQKRYSSFTTTASSGGVDTIPLSISADPLLTIASGTLDTYSDMSITWGAVNKDAGDGDGAQPYSVVIATTDSSRTLVEIYNWVQYQLTKATDIDAGAGTHLGKITTPLLDMSSSASMITRTGVWVEGFTSADVNKIVYTDDNADTHAAPLSVPVIVNVDDTGFQVAVFELDNTGYTDATYTPAAISSTIINETSASTQVSDSITYAADVPVRVIVRKAGYQQFSLYTTITSSGLTVTSLTPVDGSY